MIQPIPNKVVSVDIDLQIRTTGRSGDLISWLFQNAWQSSCLHLAQELQLRDGQWGVLEDQPRSVGSTTRELLYSASIIHPVKEPRSLGRKPKVCASDHACNEGWKLSEDPQKHKRWLWLTEEGVHASIGGSKQWSVLSISIDASYCRWMPLEG